MYSLSIKYNKNKHNKNKDGSYLQMGGSACDNILYKFDPCDILQSSTQLGLEYIIEKPINKLIDVTNIFINKINDLVWVILNYVVQMFSSIISLINSPINSINILTREIRQLSKLSLDLLSGDILAIIIVYTLPIWFYIQTIIIRILSNIILPFQSVFEVFFSIFGITINDVKYFTFYHLFLVVKYILIIIYFICVYGFIKLIF